MKSKREQVGICSHCGQIVKVREYTNVRKIPVWGKDYYEANGDYEFLLAAAHDFEGEKCPGSDMPVE